MSFAAGRSDLLRPVLLQGLHAQLEFGDLRPKLLATIVQLAVALRVFPDQFNMRAASVAGVAAFAFVSGCATTPDDTSSDFAPPPVGTEIDWTTTYANGARENYTSRLVAVGDDFEIYLADTELPGDEPYHYYAEFAGGVFSHPAATSCRRRLGVRQQ